MGKSAPGSRRLGRRAHHWTRRERGFRTAVIVFAVGIGASCLFYAFMAAEFVAQTGPR
ncbi:MAG: hypothetical protein JNJ73_18655 [Hyphomonadaceae bacterium]|nr:hypothetical protein [Hyphomonadaceae bacterium]